MKWLKPALWGVAGLIVLLAIAVAVFVARFDVNRYKPLAVEWMKTHKNRDLVIGGPIELSVFPRVELKVSGLSLSERARPEAFAKVDSASFSLHLLPLLSRQAVIDKVQAQGVALNYKRNADGTSNIDDLLEPAGEKTSPSRDEPGQPLALDISGVDLRDIAVSVDDRKSHVAGTATLSTLNMGRLGQGRSAPVRFNAALALTESVTRAKLSGQTELSLASGPGGGFALKSTDVHLSGDLPGLRGGEIGLKGDLSFDGARQAWRAANLALSAAGDTAGLALAQSQLTLDSAELDPSTSSVKLVKLELSAKGARAGEPLNVELKWPSLDVKGEQLNGSPLSGALEMGGATAMKARFSSGQPSGSFKSVRVPQLKLAFEGGANTQASGQVQTDLVLQPQPFALSLEKIEGDVKAQVASLGAQAFSIKGSAAVTAKEASVAASGLWGPAGGKPGPYAVSATLKFQGVTQITANLLLPALDLDTLMAPGTAAPKTAAAPKEPPVAAADDAPIDLSALANFHGHVEASVGALTARRIHFTNVRLVATGDGKTFALPSFATEVWGGKLQGSASVQPAGNRVALDANGQGVRIEQALRDLAGRDNVLGAGQLALNLQTSGRTVGQMMSALAGRARVALRDCAIKGINLAKLMREAKAAISLQKDQMSTARNDEHTDFSEITASFDIAQGVARNNDLLGKSPFLRIGGAGEIDIGRSTLNYTVKAAVTDTAQGQGGPELALLRGLEVPVRVSGPLSAPQYQVQWSAVAAVAAQQAVKNRLGDELKKRLGVAAPAPAASGAAPAKPADVLKDRLKGLLGR